MPERDKVFVCSAYGCRTQTEFKFTSADITNLQSMMSAAQTATPADERKATAATLAWMEQQVGDAVGTSADRPGHDLAGNGDPTQMDCVDIATHLSSYLLILERHKLFRHHTVGSVFAKEDLRRGVSGWLHFAAVLISRTRPNKSTRWTGPSASGQPPEIIEVEKWYIDDSAIVFGKE